MKAVNIEWDIDIGDNAVLPKEIDIPEVIVDEDEISDYISDLTGYCHKGFEIKLSDYKQNKKNTNEYAIRNLWSIEQLASELIRYREEKCWDYDYDDEPYVCGRYDIFITSDDEEFSDFEEAVEHEIWWLNQEVNS